MSGYYEICSKCKHKDVDEHNSPCKECIDAFFDDWKNPKRKFGKYFERRKRMNSEKCEYIQNMKSKLCNNDKLTYAEIHTIIAALSESEECFQEPYYELVYHDKYDRIERRAINPVRSFTYKTDEIGVVIKEETFDFKFRRIVREEDE